MAKINKKEKSQKPQKINKEKPKKPQKVKKEKPKKPNNREEVLRYYDKRRVIDQVIENRGVDFYVDKSTKYNNIAFYMAIAAFIITISKFYFISQYETMTRFNISGVDGKIHQLIWTEEKKKKTFDAIVEIREKRNEKWK